METQADWSKYGGFRWTEFIVHERAGGMKVGRLPKRKDGKESTVTKSHATNGAPTCTPQLRELIEGEFEKYGYIGSKGDRRIALASSMRVISQTLGVSEGTVKNAFTALKAQGYILKQEPGMYLLLAPATDASTLSLKASVEDGEDRDDYEVGDAEGRRLRVEEVVHMIRDVLMTCDMETANAVIDSHRRWCVMNRLTPHI